METEGRGHYALWKRAVGLPLAPFSGAPGLKKHFNALLETKKGPLKSVRKHTNDAMPE